MATELCTACGCGIVNNSTPAGKAVRHSDKLYCPECAELILSPEELSLLSKPAAARAPGSRAAMKAVSVPAGGDEIGEEEPLADEVPAVRSPQSRRGTAQPNVRPGSRRETSSVGDRATSARAGKRRGTSVVGRRDAGVVEAREQARGGKSENSRAKKRGGDNTLLYVIAGVVVVALCFVGYIFLRGDNKPDKKKIVATAPEDSDKTSSTEYARRAEDFAAKKDNAHAAEMYRKAADKAEKEKNFDQAKIYGMKIVSMEKASTINDGAK